MPGSSPTARLVPVPGVQLGWPMPLALVLTPSNMHNPPCGPPAGSTLLQGGWFPAHPRTMLSWGQQYDVRWDCASVVCRQDLDLTPEHTDCQFAVGGVRVEQVSCQGCCRGAAGPRCLHGASCKGARALQGRAKGHAGPPCPSFWRSSVRSRHTEGSELPQSFPQTRDFCRPL